MYKSLFPSSHQNNITSSSSSSSSPQPQYRFAALTSTQTTFSLHRPSLPDTQTTSILHRPSLPDTQTTSILHRPSLPDTQTTSMYGNDYKALMAGLASTGSANVTDISKGMPDLDVGPEPIPEPAPEAAEGFLDVLKDIGRVVSPITQQGLSFASPLLGPLGGPVSAIGGIALGALSKVCEESALDEDKAPSFKLQDGMAQRAILAEAALQTVLRMERSPANKRIMDIMTAKYHGSGFDADKANKLGAKLVPLMSQAGLHLAINENLITNKKEATGVQKIKPHGPELIIPSADTQVEEFLDAAAQAEVKMWRTVGKEDKSEAEFFNDLTQFLATGSQAPKPALIFGNRADLTTGQKQLEAYLSKKTGNEWEATDLAVRPSPTDKTRPISDAHAAGYLAHRAIVAECALQAVLEADKGDLQESVILGDTGSAEPESFFDGLLKTVQMMGSAVVKVAPKVLDVALPILLDTVKSHARAESMFDTPMVPPPAPRPNGVKAARGGFASVSTASVKRVANSGGGYDKPPFFEDPSAKA